MFKNISQDIVFYCSKKNILHQEKKEIYEYAIEVILLNGSLLLTFLGLSLLAKQFLFFVYFICFFVPLRMYSGGFHAKSSEACYGISVLGFSMAMMIVKYKSFLLETSLCRVLAVVMIAILFLFSPIENENHPLDKHHKQRNKRITRVLTVIDLILLIVFCMNGTRVATYESIFIVMNGILLLIGKLFTVKNAV